MQSVPAGSGAQGLWATCRHPPCSSYSSNKFSNFVPTCHPHRASTGKTEGSSALCIYSQSIRISTFELTDR